MFVDTSLDHSNFDHSFSHSFGSSTSSTSYPSNSSDISASWQSANTTPASSPYRLQSRNSSVKLEDEIISMDQTYGQAHGFSAHQLSQLDMEAYQNATMFSDPSRMMAEQVTTPYSFNYFTPPSGSFNSGHGLPGLERGLNTPNSCSSGVQEDFVDPTRTTFMEDSFHDLASPFHASKVDFTMDYPAVEDYDTNFAFVESPQGVRVFSPYSEAHCATPSPMRHEILRQSMHMPLPTTAALHRVQARQETARDTTQQTRLQRKRRQQARIDGLPCAVRVEKGSTFKCLIRGCNRSFKRCEHLKRHQKTHQSLDMFSCEICSKDFNRTDNLKAHTKLHDKPDTDKTKSSRTRYDPRAAGILAKMARRSKRGDRNSSEVPSEMDRQSAFSREQTSSV